MIRYVSVTILLLGFFIPAHHCDARLPASPPVSRPPDATLAGTPAPPILITPANETTVNLVAPGNTTLTFTWRRAGGEPAPTSYKLCVTEMNKRCNQPGAWIVPFIREVPLASASHTAPLPEKFQGKRLRWSVSACAPSPVQTRTGGVREVCATSATRVLSWALPPPILHLPADRISATPRQVFTAVSVPGADYYLFCFSKPGVACPFQPTATSNTIVAEVRGGSQYSGANELAQFDDQTIHWTAAACNATFGCVYQQAVRAVTFTAQDLACQNVGSVVRLSNGKYLAQIVHTGGMSVTRLKPDGSADSVAFSGDGIGLSFDPPLPLSVVDPQLTDVQVSVEKCYSFYARVSVVGKLDFPNLATFVVKRTYEFTRSANIYVQMELRLERAFGPVRVLPEDSARVRSFSYSFRTDPRTRVFTTTSDLLVWVPDGPLGGLNSGLSGSHGGTISPTSVAGGWGRIVGANGSNIVLRSGFALLSNSVVAINSPDLQPPLDFSIYPFNTYQFYPTFGLRDITTDTYGNVEYHFNAWNSYKYAMENTGLIDRMERNRQTEDVLIRYTMFLIERLALDEGWWKLPAWTGGGDTYFPRGDRAATNSRSFPALAYVWAHLTMRKTPAGWIHVPSDADVIYHQLQQTYQYYINSDPASNLADNTSTGVPYIAYSAHHRERLGGGEVPRRVINAHSTALHFAWLMQEASSLFGDSVRVQQWADVVNQNHRGSKALFQQLYPGRDPANAARTYRGFIGYSPHQPEIKMPYVSIAYEGMASGYLNAGEFEPEFADVVERASRQDSNIDPCNRDQPRNKWDRYLCNDDGTDKRESYPAASYVARLVRAFPAALAFVRPVEHIDGTCIASHLTEEWQESYQTWGPDMSRDLSNASLIEVLGYDRSRGKRIHNPAKFISEGNGRKWIRTNTQFLSYWAPGFWEEVDSDQVPADVKFDIRVALPVASSCLGNHYSVYRMGNKIFIMTDYSGGTITLELPGTPVQVPLVKRRIYNQTTGRWAPEQVANGVNFTRTGGSVLVELNQIQQKALTIVEIQP